MTKVIGFTGKKGHGKDTAASVLLDAPFYYSHVNFATALKEMCRIVYGLRRIEMTDPRLKETPLDRWPHITPREVMQKGGEKLRELFPETWVMAWQRQANTHSRVVCTDVRYPNEAKLIKDMGGHIIRIINPRVPDNQFSNHSSETQIDELPADCVIINDKDIDHLHREVYTLMRHYYA